MSKKLNRYARRKRDKKLDFIKGCHRKNFRLERYVRTYNAFPIITRIEKDTLHESRVRFPIELLKCWYPEYFKFEYVRNTWDEYPEWKYKTNFYRFWKTERNQLGRLLRDKEVKGSNRLNSEKAQNAEQDFINFLHDFLKDKSVEEKEELLNTKSIIWFREQYRKHESKH